MVQWLGLSTFNAEIWVQSLVGKLRSQIPQAVCCSQKKTKNKEQTEGERTREETFWKPFLRTVQAEKCHVWWGQGVETSVTFSIKKFAFRTFLVGQCLRLRAPCRELVFDPLSGS